VKVWGSLTIKFHRSEKKISSVLLKKYLLGMSKNVLSNLKICIC